MGLVEVVVNVTNAGSRLKQMRVGARYIGRCNFLSYFRVKGCRDKIKGCKERTGETSKDVGKRSRAEGEGQENVKGCWHE